MSLIDGWFPWFVGVLAIASAAVGLSALPVRFYRRWGLAVLGGALLVTVLLVYAVHHVKGLIADPTDDYPQYIDAMAFTAFAVLAVAIASWTRSRRRLRVLLVIAGLSMLAFTGDQAAIRYGYPPDLRTLLGLEVRGAHRFHSADFTPITPVASAPPTTLAPAITPQPPPPLEQTWHPTDRARRGQLLSQVPIPGVASGFGARSAYVYLPPAYFSTPRPALPVMVLLSGVPGQPKNFLAGLATQDVYAALARQHGGLAPILVFADYTGGMTDDRGCIDSLDGNVETYLSRDVPAFVEQTFGSGAGPAAMGIGGFSDGGTCALMIGLRHPDVFGPILAISADQAPSLNGSAAAYAEHFLAGNQAALGAHSPMSLLRDGTPRAATRIYFESGDQEPAKQRQAVTMAGAARHAGIPTQLVTKPGRHNFDFWTICMADSAPWVAQALGVIG